jgi:two-component system chemotaxis response regulator CheB
MQHNREHSVVRVLLAGAEAKDRLHLRRILSGESGVEITGHIRPGVPADDILQHCPAEVMLIDLGDNLSTAKDALSVARSRDMKVVVTTVDPGLAVSLGLSRSAILARPATLEAESLRSPFGAALRQRLLDAGPAAAGPVTAAAVASQAIPTIRRPFRWTRPDLIAIGCSTGGPQALPELLSGIAGRVAQPILITQHMPAAFTRQLAAHLSRYTQQPTEEAAEGMPVLPGKVYVAAGGKHLLVEKKGDQMLCHLDDGPPENSCRPAVDPMLRSIIAAVGGRALAVILTGMGHDGLAGCRGLVDAGGTVVAQDEATSVVWGMPGAVAQAGLCRAVLPLNKISEEVIAAAGAGL